MAPLPSPWPTPRALDYSIHSCSSCSSDYHPFNIIDDAPSDPTSRWSGSGPPNPASRDSLSSPGLLPKKKDYIIIDLGKPCILRSITFGKFRRPHPCNVKLFRIWGGLAPGEAKGDFRALLHPQPIPATRSLSLPSDGQYPVPPLQPTSLQNPKAPVLSSILEASSPSKNALDDRARPRVRVRGDRIPSSPRMELLAQGELKNDPLPETVPLRWKTDPVPWLKPALHHPPSSFDSWTGGPGIVVPVRYVKIEPLSAAGSNYNCSIWHVSVKGHDEEHIVQPCLEKYEKWKAAAALRLCLKHLRQAGHIEAFNALLKSASDPQQSPTLIPPSAHSSLTPAYPHSPTRLDPDQSDPHPDDHPPSLQFHFEHSLASALYAALLPQSAQSAQQIDAYHSHSTRSSPRRRPSSSCTSTSIPAAEQVVRQAASAGLFDDWARSQAPTLTFQLIRPPAGVSRESPCPRGGHQMCIDSQRRKIWLFGGFDGCSDLADLWVYHLPQPEASSHHDAVSSPSCTSWIGDDTVPNVVDGRVGGSGARTSKPLNNGSPDIGWELVSRDVKADGGPINRSCHNMVLDELTGDLYVLGRYSERRRTRSSSKFDSGLKSALSNGNWSLTSERRSGQPGTNTPPPPTGVDQQTVDSAAQPDRAESGSEATPSLIELVIRARAAYAEDLANVNGATESQGTHAQASAVATTDTAETGLDQDPAGWGETPPTTIADAHPVPTPSPALDHFKSDFFRFHPYQDPSTHKWCLQNGRIGKWERISSDTHAEGGPTLIFDHQMVLDSEARKIYVFGGKVIQPLSPDDNNPSGGSPSRPGPSQYSGLFEYDLVNKSWINIMSDPEPGVSSLHEATLSAWIPSRMGHSLILDKKRHSLWILTGERDGHYYSDLWKYDVKARQSELVSSDYTFRGPDRCAIDCSSSPTGIGPEAGFSQRTTFDPEADEWHMFCGLCRDREASDTVTKPQPPKGEIMSSEFWRWRISEGKWTKVVMMAEQDGLEAPPPRFAHQMVFDQLTKIHYVFGGHPAVSDDEPVRLGDFWRLKLVQPTSAEALRRCLFALRRQHFIELCESGGDTVGALHYLQNDLSSVTNHLNDEEARLFRACTTHLLAGPGPRLPLLEEDLELDDYAKETGEDLKMDEVDCPPSSNWNMEDGSRDERNESLKLLEGNMLEPSYRAQRAKLLQDLLKFFPPSLTEPQESLIDMIDAWDDRENFGC